MVEYCFWWRSGSDAAEVEAQAEDAETRSYEYDKRPSSL